ncbi:MAG: hypothetical protein F4Y42_18045 [Caldilineaceae bacterium SB0664_bin_27]|uniref:Uncharacterized protein n=1 Tax=Caldilineaceae bacterium SB0664_bin_27 TaxID=2605260 RepID=A0A6B0YXJ5_9CHLR|nr:hypothetical protein [Caldilineaceae bacterium SB0664_bin_27]
MSNESINWFFRILIGFTKKGNLKWYASLSSISLCENGELKLFAEWECHFKDGVVVVYEDEKEPAVKVGEDNTSKEIGTPDDAKDLRDLLKLEYPLDENSIPASTVGDFINEAYTEINSNE